MKKILIAFFSICSFQLISSEINWSAPPAALSSVGQSATDPQIAMDASGNVVAVWVEGGLVKSKSKPANMNWSVSPNSLSGLGASTPSVVADPNGNATAVWVENGVIKAASKPFNGSWNPSGALSGANAATPSLAVDSAGNVIAAWVQNGNVQTSTRLFGGIWQGAATLGASGSALPSIAMGGSGVNRTAVVVWQGVENSSNVIYAATKPVAASWGSKQIISDTSHQAGYAHAAVNGNGDATAVWYSYDVAASNYSGVIVQSAFKSFSGNWTSVVDLSDQGIRNPATLAVRIAYDGSGNAIALWNTSFDDETFSVQSAIKSVAGEWTAPSNLVTGNVYSYQADLAVASLGDALALYMFYNGSDLLIQSSELDITGFMDAFWSVPIILSPGAKNAYPMTAAALTGNVINAAAVWVNSNGTYNSVVASTGTKSLLLPPSNLAVTQQIHDFGVFSEYSNTVSWNASPDPKVVGYLVYRNGVFLEQVSASVLQVIDDNRVENGAATYGVASVDSQNFHSRIATVHFP